jgi:hypothetical protein
MTTFVDAEAGFATFTQGRSLCVRLDGSLDGAMARGIAARLHDDRDSVRLRLECSTLRGVEPGAARTLAQGLLAWARGRADRSVDVLNLEPALAERMAWHPLRPFLDPDELVFIDPDRDDVWAATPSRH